MYGRYSSSIVGAKERRDTGTEKGIIGGQADRTDSGEEMGVIAEAMGIHPTPHTPKTDNSARKTGTKVVRCEHGLSVTGERDDTQ